MLTSTVVVLDNVRSRHNVGAAFRIADAFLVKWLYLCGITATPPHRDIHKTALGAEDSVSWQYATHTLDVLAQLKQQGYIIASVEQTPDAMNLASFSPVDNQKYGFVFGHEIWGVSQESLATSDLHLEIPQYGAKHSLNVATSIGITLWDLLIKSQL